ncbi:MAG: flagellar biosynthesis protein FlhF [Phycisphaerales bacterium]|nr:flagellar biosynthesis protein FlhF [Phycisphaerales bacterium]
MRSRPAMDGKKTLKTYQADSMVQALDAVKRDLGKDAVILHTRTFKRRGLLGFRTRQIVEITAGTGLGIGQPRGRRAARPTDTADLRSAGIVQRTYGQSTSVRSTRPAMAQAAPVVPREPMVAHVAPEQTASVDSFDAAQSACAVAVAPQPQARSDSDRRGDAPQPAPEPVYRTTKRLVRPMAEAPAAVPDAVVGRLDQQMTDLRSMVSKVLEQTHRPPDRALLPEALFDRYLSLLQSEVSTDIANRIVEAVRTQLSGEELTDPNIVHAAVLRELAAYIPVAEISLDRGRPKDGRPLTIAMVGPTGVGKTTTIAKLAAAFKLRHNKSVGLVTCDTYRIAAVDQLRTYANIIGLPLRVALTPNETASAVRSLSGCDVILLDTAGRSQHDELRIDELRKFVHAAEPHEVHLVLSSTSSERLLLRAAERFAPVEPTNVVFTKLDEAVSFGVLINVVQSIKKRISFVTTGQEVPDHIEIGRSDRLARMIVSGGLS